MSDKSIDLSKMECVAYITDGGYMYQYIYYDEETKQFFSEGYHYGSVDDAEEHYDGIETLTFEQALRKVYPKIEGIQKFRKIKGLDLESALKKVAENYKNHNVPEESVKRVINSNLTSDDCAYYYECENGVVFKYSQTTQSFYRYNQEKDCWLSDDNTLFTLLNQEHTEYNAYQWRVKCGVSDLDIKTTEQNVSVEKNEPDKRLKKNNTSKMWLYLILLLVSAVSMPLCAMVDMWYPLLMSIGLFIFSLCTLIAYVRTRIK